MFLKVKKQPKLPFTSLAIRRNIYKAKTRMNEIYNDSGWESRKEYRRRNLTVGYSILKNDLQTGNFAGKKKKPFSSMVGW